MHCDIPTRIVYIRLNYEYQFVPFHSIHANSKSQTKRIYKNTMETILFFWTY